MHDEIKHLLALLRMLPDPSDEEAWNSLWRQIGKAVGDIGIDHWRDVFAEQLKQVRNTSPGSPKWATHASYLGALPLMCLAVEGEAKEKLWRLFDFVGPYKKATDGAVGRRWLEDLLATAWRIEVASIDEHTPEYLAKDDQTRRELLLAREHAD
ncbi:hypothetical protein [Actinopolymorpha alba]|uniref:hypothetical protein n=1 Tax=Actinopolymorpha alba TaxID=533267 RepID=UPI000370CA99|nr:hypothetical protein [Actinopolymorpha alba]